MKESAKTSTDFYPWDMDDIDDNLLQQSTPLALTLNEAEQEYQPIFSFKFDALPIAHC